jgi:DnaK suppressor protein
MDSSILPAPELSDSQRRTLRAQLESQYNFRVEQLADLRAEEAQPGRFAVDQQILESLLAGARGALHDIEDALHRLDEGSYGHCADCGRPQPFEQLELLPQVSTCAACAPRHYLA